MSVPSVLSEGTVVEDFDLASEWTADSTAYAAADTRFSKTLGKRGCKLALKATSASSTVHYWTKTISSDLSSYGGMFEFKFYIPASPLLTTESGIKVEVGFSSTTDWTKHFSFQSATNVHSGWNYMRIAPEDWVNTGSESWSNTMLRLRIGMKPSWTGNMNVLYADTLTGGVETMPVVVFSFWDNYSIDWARTNVFDVYGWKGDICYDFHNEFDEGRLSTTDLAEVLADGWSINEGINQSEVLDTSYVHTSIGTFDPDLLEAIHQYNFNEHFNRNWSLPWHSYGTYACQVALPELYQMLAKNNVRSFLKEAPSNRYVNANPIDDPYQLVRYELGSAVTLAAARTQLTNTMNRGGVFIIGVQQVVESGPSTYDWTRSDYGDLCSDIRTYEQAGTLKVLNFDEMLDFCGVERQDETMLDKANFAAEAYLKRAGYRGELSQPTEGELYALRKMWY